MRHVLLCSTLASVRTWESVSFLGREGWLLFWLLTREVREGWDSGGGDGGDRDRDGGRREEPSSS